MAFANLLARKQMKGRSATAPKVGKEGAPSRSRKEIESFKEGEPVITM
jgi:hypothetical protein